MHYIKQANGFLKVASREATSLTRFAFFSPLGDRGTEVIPIVLQPAYPRDSSLAHRFQHIRAKDFMIDAMSRLASVIINLHSLRPFVVMLCYIIVCHNGYSSYC
jgi:hypothetical protein